MDNLHALMGSDHHNEMTIYLCKRGMICRVTDRKTTKLKDLRNMLSFDENSERIKKRKLKRLLILIVSETFGG